MLRRLYQLLGSEFRTTRRMRRGRHTRPALEWLEDRTLPASYNALAVTDLVADINLANASGGTNQITLTATASSPYVLQAALPDITAGDTLAILGQGDTIERSTAPNTPAFRLFTVDTGAALTLENLTLTNGLAQGSGTAAEGGAIYSAGTLTVDSVTVTANTAQGSTGKKAAGGGVYVAGGSAMLTNDTFSNNNAKGGDGSSSGSGGHGDGGAIFVSAGTVTLSNDLLLNNHAAGGQGGHGAKGSQGSQGSKAGAGGNGHPGGNGGDALGGALDVNTTAGVVTATNDLLSGNTAAGGAGGAGGTGGDGAAPGSGASDRGGNGGTGGQGGEADGGAVYAAASVRFTSDTLSNNSATGGAGAGGQGGQAKIGSGSYGVPGFPGSAGSGNKGGPGDGGAVYASGAVTLTNVTLYNNNATGGAGGGGSSLVQGTAGGGGDALGAGLYAATGSVALTNDTVSSNTATGGKVGTGIHLVNVTKAGSAYGGGVDVAGQSTAASQVALANTLIAGNSAATGPDANGSFASSDHDLIGNSSGFIAKGTGDILNPKSLGLGSLTDLFGGPLAGAPGSHQVVPTLTLLSGSPAVDAGDSTAVPGPTDERGYARIVGKAVDIGAYELGAAAAATDLSIRGQVSLATATGGPITYTLTVTNNSATAQNAVTLTDLLPAKATLVSWTQGTGAAGWSIGSPPLGNGRTVAAWIASLAGHASATFTLVVKLSSTVIGETVVHNAASVGPFTGDPNLPNNSLTFTTTVHPVDVTASISVSKGSLNYNAGLQQWTQTVTFTNTTGNTLNGTLALELMHLSSNATVLGANGAIGGIPYVDVSIPPSGLAAGQSVTVTLYFKAPKNATITYDAKVLEGI